MDTIVIGDLELPLTLLGFVVYLAGAGPFVSMLLERLSFWEGLEPGWKEVLSALPFFGMPVLSRGLADVLALLTPAQLDNANGWYVWFVTALAAWVLSKATNNIRSLVRRRKFIADLEVERLIQEITLAEVALDEKLHLAK